MLDTDKLKNYLSQGKLTRVEKLLLILATFDRPCQVKEIKARAKSAGLRVVEKWSISGILVRSPGKAIRTPEGWEISQLGREHLHSLGFSQFSPTVAQVATDLRIELKKILDVNTRVFVEEAIKCYEHEFFRSAVVMSWLAAVNVLYKIVITSHLVDFNNEVKRIYPKWKPAKTIDDLGRMKERDFLDRLEGISIIGKSVKSELVKCLDLRNGCGHPNSLKIGANTVAHHLEVLLLNVFKPFS